MIEADEGPGGIPPEPEEEQRGLPPGKAFFLLLAILIAVAAVVLVLTARGGEEPGEPRAGAFQLSDEQALERFHELWALDERARIERDPSLISLIYTSDSESGEGAADALRDYLQDDLYDRSEVELIQATVGSTSIRQVEIEVVSHFTPCIIDETGRSVLRTEPVKVEIEATWILGLEESIWKVRDIRSTSEHIIDTRVSNECTQT
jgi:hypothetical protein